MKKKLIKRATKAGIPSDFLYRSIRFGRIAAQPRDFLRRRKAANLLRDCSPYRDTINREKGYALLNSDDMPELMEAVAAAQSVFAAKSNSIASLSSNKPFFVNILEAADLDQHPEFMALASSEQMMESAACYLGTYPDLRSVSVFISPANDLIQKSQRYHIDNIDMTQVKCFINVSDVKPENGPFSFIPADVSERIKSELGYRFPSPSIDDDTIFSMCEPDNVVSLVGSPGTAALVDTSKCLHFGSRCREGCRVVIMLQYVRRPHLGIVRRSKGGGTSLLLGGD